MTDAPSDDVVRFDIDEPTARNEILIDTRQYAKRQRTWFRHQLAPERVTRIDPEDSDAIDRAQRRLPCPCRNCRTPCAHQRS